MRLELFSFGLLGPDSALSLAPAWKDINVDNYKRLGIRVIDGKIDWFRLISYFATKYGCPFFPRSECPEWPYKEGLVNDFKYKTLEEMDQETDPRAISLFDLSGLTREERIRLYHCVSK